MSGQGSTRAEGSGCLLYTTRALRAEEKVQKENPGAKLAEQERLTQELFKKMSADRQKMKLEYTNSLLARAARVAR